MATLIKRNTRSRTIGWWVLQLLAGAAFTLTGIWMAVYPAESYLSLSLVFALGLVVAGVSEGGLLLGHLRGMTAWGWHLAFALIDIGVGVYLLFYPVSMSLLPFLAGFWILVRGSLAVGIALDFRSQHAVGWGWPLYIGIIAILLAFIILTYPFLAVVGVIGYTSISLIGFGILHCYLTTKLWKSGR